MTDDDNKNCSTATSSSQSPSPPTFSSSSPEESLNRCESWRQILNYFNDNKFCIFTAYKKLWTWNRQFNWLFCFLSLALSKMMARPRPWKKRHRHFEVETNNSDLGGSNNSSPGNCLQFYEPKFKMLKKNYATHVKSVCLCEWKSERDSMCVFVWVKEREREMQTEKVDGGR